MTNDPLHALAHDHEGLNRRVLALGAIMTELERDGQVPAPRALVAPVGELRELLFLHFAREEEGLFPFVGDVVPDLADRVREMETAHDAICGAVARMFDLAATNAPLVAILPVFRRFENAYAEHASTEALLLKSLDQRLDAEQRARLATLVDGL